MRIIVVGAGVSGLTAGRELVRAGHDVTVLESSNEVGGKVRGREVGGVVVDVGAESMLARRPEGIALAEELGLDVVHPTDASSRVWTRGALRPLPRSLMGVPMDVAGLAASGVLSDDGIARVRSETTLPAVPIEGDLSVGSLVDERLGTEVTDRLVEPLLGGVYAGRAREISARAAVPQLIEMAGRGSLVEQVAAIPATSGPVFGGVAGGMSALTRALADGLDVRTGAMVSAIERRPSGFTVIADGSAIECDGVVVATPAGPTSRLLADVAPAAAAELARIEYASMAVVSLAFRTSDIEDVPSLDGGRSGFLVPPIDGRRIKASTFSFAKWDWVRAAGAGSGVVNLRTSIGRIHEEASLHHTDDELVTASLTDLREATGLHAAPVDTHVQRWDDGLPQYTVGHVERVARIRAAVERVPGLELCGAAFDGVGIPAVIASGCSAARSLQDTSDRA